MFAQESEILSEVPAERGRCQVESAERRRGRPAAFFHRKPGGSGSAEKQNDFGARRRRAVGEGRGTVPLL